MAELELKYRLATIINEAQKFTSHARRRTMTADDVFTAWSALSGRAGRLPGTATAGTARLAMIEASYPGAEGPAFLLPDALGG